MQTKPQAETTRSLPTLTPAMEDYLRTIAELAEEHATVQSAAVADRLGVAAPSVTQMVQRLSLAGYLEHPRHGAITLTAAGRVAAQDICARRTLIAAYLVDALGYDARTASAEADQLEHVLSTRLRARLGERLTGTM